MAALVGLDVRGSELIGVAVAIIVLLLAFGSVVAMGLPIVTAFGRRGAVVISFVPPRVISLPEAQTLLSRRFKVDPNTFVQGLESVGSLFVGDLNNSSSVNFNLGFQSSTRKEFSHPTENIAGLHLQLNTITYDFKYNFKEKNKDDALDIVQEVAYRSFKKIDTLKKPEYFKTWLIKISIA